jgi:predicted MFS family arabinose efflux permease
MEFSYRQNCRKLFSILEMKYFINLSLLRTNRNFRLLYLGQFISLLGTAITGVAVPYQVYHETGSIFLVGLVSLFQLLPLLLTALLGGILADRHQRRALIIITELLLSLGCLLLAGNSLLTKPSIWFIFLLAAIMSGINGLHRPAIEGITQQIVEKKDFPMMAALRNFTFSSALIIGPALGGIIIAHFGIFTTFLIDFVSYILALITVFMIVNPPKLIITVQKSIWFSLKQGFQYAFSRQELVGTYVVDFTAMIFGMPMALFPAIAATHGGPKVLGILYATPAVGTLVISFLSGWTQQVKRQGAAIAIAACVWGVGIILFGVTLKINFYLALFFLASAGAADALSAIFRSTLWNQTVPMALRGRLAGIEMISYLSGPKLGDTEAGLVAAAFGVTFSIISGGVLCILGVGLCCYFLPKFWRYHYEVNLETNTEKP